jgi:hypothetical protein
MVVPRRDLAPAVMGPVDIITPRCRACASTSCAGLEAIDLCPAWQAAEARCQSGVYLTTTPTGQLGGLIRPDAPRRPGMLEQPAATLTPETIRAAARSTRDRGAAGP